MFQQSYEGTLDVSCSALSSRDAWFNGNLDLLKGPLASCSYNADKESELARRYMATGQGAPLEEEDWDSILRDL